eukprot:m.32668 g.32668  ORF g.32668 m.32668 type:complete len:148 (+) comp16677_c1_seq1:29-472(+)
MAQGSAKVPKGKAQRLSKTMKAKALKKGARFIKPRTKKAVAAYHTTTKLHKIQTKCIETAMKAKSGDVIPFAMLKSERTKEKGDAQQTTTGKKIMRVVTGKMNTDLANKLGASRKEHKSFRAESKPHEAPKKTKNWLPKSKGSSARK